MGRIGSRAPLLGSLGAALVLSACGGAGPSQSLASAKAYLEKKETAAAVIQLKNALQKDPALAEGRFLLGQTYLQSGNAVAALPELRRAHELKYPDDKVVPELARAMLREHEEQKLIDEFADATLADRRAAADLKTSLASAWLVKNEAVKARAATDAALTLNPDYAPATRIRAVMAARAGDYDSAIRIIDESLQKSPRDADAWHTKGEFLLYGKRDVPGALVAFRQALLVNPTDENSRSSLITALLAQHDFEAAASELKMLRKTAVNKLQSDYFEAQLAFFRNDFKRSHEITDQLVRLLPDSVPVRQLAGAVELNLGLLLEAERSLNRALQMRPDLATSRRLLAQTYLRMGQPGKALDALAPLLTGTSKDAEAVSLAAEANLESGDFASAEVNFSKAAAFDPENIHSRVAVALGKIRRGKEAEAIADLRTLSASDKGTYVDLTLASLFLRRNDLQNALKAVDSVEAKRPNQPMTAHLRGRIYLLSKDVEHARKNFERALAIDPTFVPAASALALLDLSDKLPDQARARFQSILKSDPKNLDALMALAGMRAKEGASDEEMTGLMRDAIRLNPDAATPRLVLVDSQIKQKDFKAAIRTAQDGVNALPASASMLDGLGRAQLAGGEINQALSTFNTLSSVERGSPRPYLRLADVHTARGDKDGAADSYRKAFSLGADSPTAKRLYESLVSAKRSGEADSFATSWLAAHPKDASFLFAVGNAALDRHDHVAAEARFRTVLSIAPDNAAALNNVAWIMATDGKRGAVEFAKKATTLVPTSASLWDTLALALAAERRLPEAIAAQSKAVNLAPAQSGYRVSLAKLHIDAGDKAKARAELESVAKAADRNEFQSRVEEQSRRL